jgi:hypothetical protein
LTPVCHIAATPLKHKAREHPQQSKATKKLPFYGIFHHISNCLCYKSNLKNYFEKYKNLPGPLKITNFQLEK